MATYDGTPLHVLLDYVNAGSAPVTVTLAATSRGYVAHRFIKTDSSTNAVTITDGGSYTARLSYQYETLDVAYNEAAAAYQTVNSRLLTTDSPVFTTKVQEGAAQAAAGSLVRVVKKVTAFSDGVAKDVFTVTVPNGAHASGIRILACCSLGDADGVSVDDAFVAVERLAGSNTSYQLDTKSFVSGGANARNANYASFLLSTASLAGAADATQTFKIQCTISRAGGASDNHYGTFVAELLNNNTSGVTIA